MYSYLKHILYDKLLKPRQLFRITLYIPPFAVYLDMSKSIILTSTKLLLFTIGSLVPVIFLYPSPKRETFSRNMKCNPFCINKQHLQVIFYSTELLLTNGFSTESNITF